MSDQLSRAARRVVTGLEREGVEQPCRPDDVQHAPVTRNGTGGRDSPGPAGPGLDGADVALPDDAPVAGVERVHGPGLGRHEQQTAAADGERERRREDAAVGLFVQTGARRGTLARVSDLDQAEFCSWFSPA